MRTSQTASNAPISDTTSAKVPHPSDAPTMRLAMPVALAAAEVVTVTVAVAAADELDAAEPSVPSHPLWQPALQWPVVLPQKPPELQA